MLVEPLEIANWYGRDKNATNRRHYTDGIAGELTDDNHKRPGCYNLVQQQEARVFGDVQSSLAKGAQLQPLLGERSWKTLLGRQLVTNVPLASPATGGSQTPNVPRCHHCITLLSGSGMCR